MSNSSPFRNAKFEIGAIVRHRMFPFRGVIFDVDPIFNHSEEWYQAIPAEVRPSKDQPYYHLLAENDEAKYVAYVSEQNLLPDESGGPITHPQITDYFSVEKDGRYKAKPKRLN
jgi:heat shock protein HspQ